MDKKDSEKTRENKMVNSILNNYMHLERSIAEQLSFEHQNPVAIGGFREEVWQSLFQQIIPKKFTIEKSVFIIDSGRNVSNEVDLAIFDEQYTPYIFRNGKMKFIPIEAVAVVVECKSSSPNLQVLKNWSKSIQKLKTSEKSIARFAPGITVGGAKTQKATRPVRILCHTSENDIKGSEENFDIEIYLGKDKLNIKVHKEDDPIGYWYNELNQPMEHYPGCQGKESLDVTLKEYRVGKKDQESALLTLNFQLNQLLMLINNPLLFPHLAYVEMFNDFIAETHENNM